MDGYKYSWRIDFHTWNLLLILHSWEMCMLAILHTSCVVQGCSKKCEPGCYLHDPESPDFVCLCPQLSVLHSYNLKFVIAIQCACVIFNSYPFHCKLTKILNWSTELCWFLTGEYFFARSTGRVECPTKTAFHMHLAAELARERNCLRIRHIQDYLWGDL